MTAKTFITKIIATIMVLVIAASFTAHTQVHAFEDPTYYKTTIKKMGRNHFELIIDGRKIKDETITSTCGTLAILDGFEATRDRIIASFKFNPNDYYNYTYEDYQEGDFLNKLFTGIFPKYDPNEYTCQQKNDVVNIVRFTKGFLNRLWRIQGLGATLYCSMF